MPCESDQMCSAIIMAGGRLAAGMAATSASQAPRSTAKARSPASCSSRCAAERKAGFEHGGEIGGFVAREREIGLAQALESFAQVRPAFVPGRGELLLEALEAALGDIGHQRVAIAEMPVGRRGADAGLARGFGKREAGGALFGDQIERGLDQGFPQVAMVIAAPPAAAVPVPAHGVAFSSNRAAAHRSRAVVLNGPRASVASGTTGLCRAARRRRPGTPVCRPSDRARRPPGPHPPTAP